MKILDFIRWKHRFEGERGWVMVQQPNRPPRRTETGILTARGDDIQVCRIVMGCILEPIETIDHQRVIDIKLTKEEP